jgi:hypothetical protein
VVSGRFSLIRLGPVTCIGGSVLNDSLWTSSLALLTVRGSCWTSFRGRWTSVAGTGCLFSTYQARRVRRSRVLFVRIFWGFFIV